MAMDKAKEQGGFMHTFKPAAGIRGHARPWLRIVAGATAVAIGASVSLAATAGAATTKLVPGHGNGEHGSLIKTADGLVNKLTGPKGTGLTRGVTSTAVKIGCVDTTSAYSGYQTGIQAYLNAINKKGGVNGRKLTLVGTCKNDAGSVQTNVTDNEQLVSETQVFSVLTLSGVELTGATKALNRQQVPFEGWGFEAGFCGTRWGFGWNGDLCGNALPNLPLEAVAGNLVEGMVKASGIPAKTVRFAVQGQTGPDGITGDDQYDAEIKALGGKVVYSGHNYPATATGVDNTPFVQAILATKPNIVFISTPFTDVGTLTSALRSAGYTGDIQNFVDYIPGLLTESAQLAASLQGEYVNTQIVPAQQTGAYDKAIEAALTAIGKKPFVTLGSFIGYAEAEQMAAMIKAAGKTLNTKTFTQAVNGGKGFSSYKTAPKTGPGAITWPAAHYLPADCAAIVKVTKTTYKVVEPFTCYTDFIVKK
jgi:branched-chain amino acid transport system substrate-binding protein